MSKKWIVFFILFLVFGIVYLIAAESYPVAIVNSRPISKKILNDDFTIALHYYRQIANIYDRSSAGSLKNGDSQKEIERAVLDKLIEQMLIREELERRITKSDLNTIITAKIDNAINNSKVDDKEAQAAYGVSVADFKDKILEPQARREILEGRIILENEAGTLDIWLDNAKQKAIVLILEPGFSWDGHQVIIK